ncbi:hypothetical protein ACK1C5_001668 [Salmonella enterica]
MVTAVVTINAENHICNSMDYREREYIKTVRGEAAEVLLTIISHYHRQTAAASFYEYACAWLTANPALFDGWFKPETLDKLREHYTDELSTISAGRTYSDVASPSIQRIRMSKADLKATEKHRSEAGIVIDDEISREIEFSKRCGWVSNPGDSSSPTTKY